ncbi:MAG: class I SAM-dependent methyltransferase [Planctomycetes bacterium]|nr:class I SAM-dependent methyltransferase [Planctomycetota bacterium]
MSGEDRPFCGHVPTTCAVCGADRYYVMYTIRGKHHRLFRCDGDEQVVKCKRCGLVYLNPIPDPDALLHVWSDHPVTESDISSTLADAALGDVANIRRFKTSGTLLEIGCGYGALLGEAQRAGFDVCGWEVNPRKCEYIKRTHGVENVFWEPPWERGLPDRTFDVIAMLDVIEHIREIHEILREIRRLLKDDGILYLNTPNLDGIRSRIKRRRWPYFIALSHIYFFTCETLDKLLRTEGMTVRKRLIRPSRSFARNLVKSALRTVNIFDELCVVAAKA